MTLKLSSIWFIISKENSSVQIRLAQSRSKRGSCKTPNFMFLSNIQISFLALSLWRVCNEIEKGRIHGYPTCVNGQEQWGLRVLIWVGPETQNHLSQKTMWTIGQQSDEGTYNAKSRVACTEWLDVSLGVMTNFSLGLSAKRGQRWNSD